MASRSPASSWTARSSPTSPCATPRRSPDSPTPPARRRLPDRNQPTQTTSRAPLPLKDGALFHFVIITSTHNEKLKEIRRLARRRERDERGRFVAEGEDLVAAAAQAGWAPVHLLVAAGSGLEGEEVEQSLLDSVSGLASGSRTIGVYEVR